MPKRFSTTLIFSIVIAIAALSAHTEANAKVCIMYVGGTCIFWSGSVEGELTANEIGDIIKEPKSLGFTIFPRGPGVLYCKKPDTTEPEIIYDAKFVGEFGNSVTIKRKDVDQCCQTAVVRVVAKLDDAQLQDLDKYCKDPKWEAIDFVPREFDAKVSLMNIESKNIQEPVCFKCVLPNWKDLGWEKNKPEQHPYECNPIPKEECNPIQKK